MAVGRGPTGMDGHGLVTSHGVGRRITTAVGSGGAIAGGGIREGSACATTGRQRWSAFSGLAVAVEWGSDLAMWVWCRWRLTRSCIPGGAVAFTGGGTTSTVALILRM